MENKYKELIESLEEQVELYKNSFGDVVAEYTDGEDRDLFIDERQEFLLRVKIEQLKKQIWT